MQLFLDIYLKFFFVLTPFFVLSIFLALTRDYNESTRRRVALKVTLAVVLIVFALFMFGRYIFTVFGVTLDAFKIGAGILLFLSAISLVQGRRGPDLHEEKGDISVVPLAIPITVGPATTGILFVLGAELRPITEKLTVGAAILCAVLTVGVLLFLASGIERRLGDTGLNIFSKLTGLMLASIAAQLVLTGVQHFLR
jgi:multiple antibiotic resistance protein